MNVHYFEVDTALVNMLMNNKLEISIDLNVHHECLNDTKMKDQHAGLVLKTAIHHSGTLFHGDDCRNASIKG
jgi:hypothetical protein